MLLFIVDFVFKGREKLLLDYLIIKQHPGGEGGGGGGRGGLGFSKTSLKITINHLIQNCYFNVRSVTMKQAIGIPIGTAPAPLWANVHNNLRICN